MHFGEIGATAFAAKYGDRINAILSGIFACEHLAPAANAITSGFVEKLFWQSDNNYKPILLRINL